MILRDEITDCILLYQKDHDEYYVAGKIMSLPSLVEIIKDAEKIRKANEYLEGLEGIEINDINGMVAVFNALSIIVRTGEGEDVTENFRRPE